MAKRHMREKLIELVGQVQDCGCDVTDVVAMNYVENITLVDHLIANGVTIQRWRSVTDEQPNEGEMILVCAGGEVGEAFLGYNGFCWANGFQIEKEVTHWMPLPEAPKGE